jgi:hypothetical protein
MQACFGDSVHSVVVLVPASVSLELSRWQVRFYDH